MLQLGDMGCKPSNRHLQGSARSCGWEYWHLRSGSCGLEAHSCNFRRPRQRPTQARGCHMLGRRCRHLRKPSSTPLGVPLRLWLPTAQPTGSPLRSTGPLGARDGLGHGPSAHFVNGPVLGRPTPNSTRCQIRSPWQISFFVLPLGYLRDPIGQGAKSTDTRDAMHVNRRAVRL